MAIELVGLACLLAYWGYDDAKNKPTAKAVQQSVVIIFLKMTNPEGQSILARGLMLSAGDFPKNQIAAIWRHRHHIS